MKYLLLLIFFIFNTVVVFCDNENLPMPSVKQITQNKKQKLNTKEKQTASDNPSNPIESNLGLYITTYPIIANEATHFWDLINRTIFDFERQLLLHNVNNAINDTLLAPVLSSSNITSSGVNLAWNSIAGATGYNIFENINNSWQKIASTTGISYNVTGLTANTSYSFEIDAYNSSATSAMSSPLTVQTLMDGTNPAANFVFSPYIDMSLSTAFSLLNAVLHGGNPAGISAMTLAFVQGNGAGDVSWSGLSNSLSNDSIPDGGQGTSIQTITQELEANNIQLAISVGGAVGIDPAVYAVDHNQTAAQLAAEYESIITRYHLQNERLDFDVEGSAVGNHTANELRAEALAIVQQHYPNTEISFTLAVLPTGLTADGLNVLQDAINNHVNIGMVNIMAMDYGSAVDNHGDMLASAEQAITAATAQMNSLGLTHTTLEVTPMIGVNDTAGEIFTTQNATDLMTWLADHHYTINGVHIDTSMWSLGRDNHGTTGVLSPTSSGTAQTDYQFSHILNGH